MAKKLKSATLSRKDRKLLADALLNMEDES